MNKPRPDPTSRERLLYRVFLWDHAAPPREPGGSLFVPRKLQGPGRFDIPHKDGVLYVSENPDSALGEFLQRFRGRHLKRSFFTAPQGFKYSLVALGIEKANLVDLDDPATLIELKIRPSQYLSSDRKVTQNISELIHNKGFHGFTWCSSLDGAWINATLFESRVIDNLTIVKKPVPLSIQNKAVQDVCRKFSIAIL